MKILRTKILLAISVLWLLPAQILSPQDKSKPYVSNTRMEVVNDSIIKIFFTIESSDSSRLHEVKLIFFSSDDNKAIFPSALQGDEGFVRGGGDKCITWSFSSDFKHLEEDFYPMVILDGSSLLSSKSGGWKNAILSVAVPGLGDYFVTDQRNLKIKPWMKTVSSIGLIGMGYYCDKTRTRDQYVELKYVMGSPYEGAPYVPMFVPYLKPGEVHYRLFKWDAELFYTLGAAIWITDVLWVFNKGYINDKISRFYYGKDLKIIAGTGGVGLRLTF